jgi:hypothetical protein
MDAHTKYAEIKLDHLKFADDETGSFTGIASAVNIVDRDGDVIAPGAFDKTLKDKGSTRPLLMYHDMRRPVGLVHLALDAEGHLIVERGEFNLETQDGREARALAKQGALTGLSIGFRVPQGAAEYDTERGIQTFKEADVWEVSMCVYGANPAALVDSVKSIMDEVKAGRVLSAANRAKLVDARDALDAVLKADQPDDEDTSKSVDNESVGHATHAQAIQDLKALAAQIKRETRKNV